MTDANGLGGLRQAELALLTPEYLLAGHLIDRAGMPHLIAAFGRDGMRDIAIEEWMGASPVYTKRMQRALAFEGDSVETIFKGLQLDIGAPPQFMDFRYLLIDHDHGEFWLDHCGALMDVEPMGDEYVVAMCHDIEDPTFDATAIATNPRAQMRPIHRPPRVPAGRSPACHWTVTIADTHPVLPIPAVAEAMAATRAATLELAPIEAGGPGRHDYTGPLWLTCSSPSGPDRRSGGSSTKCASRAICWSFPFWPPRAGGRAGRPKPPNSDAGNSRAWPAWPRRACGTRSTSHRR